MSTKRSTEMALTTPPPQTGQNHTIPVCNGTAKGRTSSIAKEKENPVFRGWGEVNPNIA